MNSEDSRNLILAIALSVLVLIGWQYFFAAPQLQKDRAAQQQAQTQTQPQTNARPPPPAARRAGARARPARPAQAAPKTRAEALAASPRVAIDTPSLGGSIDLKGGMIDDVVLKDYRETIDPKSPNIMLFSPAGAPDALLRRDRLRHRRAGREDAQPPDGVERRLDDADAGEAGDADLGQRRRAEVQARHLRRRQIHVHRRATRSRTTAPSRPRCAPTR